MAANRVSVVAWGILAICALAGATAQAGLDQSLRVRVDACENARCSAAEGMQGGLTVVNLEGVYPQLGGRSLQVVVVAAEDQNKVLLNTNAGVMASGNFDSSIAAFRLPAGNYYFYVVNPPQQIIARGKFQVARAAASNSRPTAAAPGLAGTYRGINGTAGVLELNGNGSYSYQGQPMGNWSASGDTVTFTGQPFAFAGNQAALQGSVLMFQSGPVGLWYAKVN